MDIVFKGPLRGEKDDVAGQQNLLEGFIHNDKVDGIVLAAAERGGDAPRSQCSRRRIHKIPVVIIDSALNGTVGKDFISYVSAPTINSAGKWPARK